MTASENPAPSISEKPESAAPALSEAPPAKFQGYTEAYRAVQEAPPPQITYGADGVPDPSSINASLNDLSARVQRLKAEKDALEQTLSPAEKGQWKAYQRSLEPQGE